VGIKDIPDEVLFLPRKKGEAEPLIKTTKEEVDIQLITHLIKSTSKPK
jgi:hypothetical protein